MEQGRNNSSGRSQGRGCPVSTVGIFAQIFPWYIISATRKDSVFSTSKCQQNRVCLAPPADEAPSPTYSILLCVQVPYSEATEAHDTESLAWGVYGDCTSGEQSLKS